MKKIDVRRFVIISIILIVLSVSGCIMDEKLPRLVIDVFPKESDNDFPTNPYKGWVVWGKSPNIDNYSQPFSMIYARLYWNQVEPVKGIYDWTGFERDWNFQRAVGNKKIVIRVVLDNPDDHLAGTGMEIPDWLYGEMGRRGTMYSSKEIGSGFSPDYTQSAIISAHKRFIDELGKRYDNDPRIAFIQIGSLGHWGEWHSWPAGTGIFPPYGIAEKYARHYIDAFKSKKLLVRRPLSVNTDHAELGLYNDLIGDPAGTPLWLSWIRNGYTSEWDRKPHPSMKENWWMKACSGGELASTPEGIGSWFENGNFEATLNHVRNAHTSWIGPNGPGNIQDPGPYQAKIDEMLRLMGYRFVIGRVSYHNFIESGKELSVGMLLENRGVAPIYYRWPFEVSLVTPSAEVAMKFIVQSVDIRAWVPGGNDVRFSVRIPEGLMPRQYIICFAILNPDDGNIPAIDFCIDRSLRLPDGRYMIGNLSVVNSGETD